MIKLLRRCGFALLTLVLPYQVTAQTTLDAVQADAEAALVAGDPTRTISLATDMLAIDPDRFAALFLLAIAQSELGQHSQAAVSARRAYNAAPTRKTRLHAARLGARERAEVRQLVRAELWLRRGAINISDEEDAELIVRQYVAISQANPLSARFNFSATPTDNINNGSESETFRLEGIPFDFFLPPERLALEGTLYVADALLSYRLSESSAQRTSVEAYIYAQTGRLTSEARKTVPDFPDDTFDLYALDLSVTHQRQFEDAPGPASFRLGYGELWNAEGSISTSVNLSLNQVFQLSNGDAFTIGGGYSDQESLAEVSITNELTSSGSLEFRNGQTYSLNTSYGMQLSTGDRIVTSLSSKLNDGGFENTFTEHTARLDYTLAEPQLGIRWSAAYELGYREYEEIFLSLDGRRDRFGLVSVTGVLDGISYFGFSPSVTVKAERTSSDVDVFTSSQVNARFSLQSVF